MVDQILITGGYGFIGSHLVQMLFDRYPEAELYNLDCLTYAANLDNIPRRIQQDRRYHSIQINIADKQNINHFFKDKSFKYIFHLAAESHVDNSIASPDVFLETNIIGTHNLLRESIVQHEKRCDFRFLHVSTDEVFGSLTPTAPAFDEDHKYFPNSPYSASKASSDHLVRAYAKTYKLPILISNCSNNYGPHQHDEKLIPTVIRSLVSKSPIPVYGNGSNIRDWIYVKDHASALIQIIEESDLYETYNVGAEQEFTNLELIDRIIACYSAITSEKTNELRRLIQFVTDRAGHDFRYAMDSSKIRKQLGWEATTGLSEGLDATVQFYLKQYA